MPKKRIVVCCDGTSNTAYRACETSPSTNVWRIACYIKHVAENSVANNGIPQYVYYQSGLGTASVSVRKWNKAWGKGLLLSVFLLRVFLEQCL